MSTIGSGYTTGTAFATPLVSGYETVWKATARSKGRLAKFSALIDTVGLDPCPSRAVVYDYTTASGLAPVIAYSAETVVPNNTDPHWHDWSFLTEDDNSFGTGPHGAELSVGDYWIGLHVGGPVRPWIAHGGPSAKRGGGTYPYPADPALDFDPIDTTTSASFAAFLTCYDEPLLPIELMSDTAIGRLAYPTAQSIFSGSGVEPRPAVCGWHGPGYFDRRGSYALVREGGPLADLLGERVQIRYRRRTVSAYVQSSSPIIEEISVDRRLFMHLAPAATYELKAEVTVL